MTTLEEVTKGYPVLGKHRIEGATRYQTFEDAKNEVDNWDSPIISIRHIVRLSDGNYVIMGHINCEDRCPYCCEVTPQLQLNTRYCCSGPHDLRE